MIIAALVRVSDSVQTLPVDILQLNDSAHQAGLMNYGDRQEDGEHLVNRNLVEQWLVWMNTYPCSWADPVCGRAASVREAEWRMWGKGSNRDKHRIPSVMSPLSCLSEGEGYCRWVVEQQAGRDTWVSRLVCEGSVLHFQEKRGAIRGPQRETLTELTSCRSPDGQPDSEWVCVYMLDFCTRDVFRIFVPGHPEMFPTIACDAVDWNVRECVAWLGQASLHVISFGSCHQL